MGAGMSINGLGGGGFQAGNPMSPDRPSANNNSFENNSEGANSPFAGNFSNSPPGSPGLSLSAMNMRFGGF